jgi:hypothetical protein
MPCFRRVVPVLAAVAVVGIARAEPEHAPVPADAARLNERYVIEPGAEALFADMLGSGQTLPGGCTLRDGQIERTSVLAIYTCGGGEAVLQLHHPEMAPRGGGRTQRFAVTVKSGAPPTGLVDAVAERIRAREAAFEWKSVGGNSPGGAQTMRWSVLIAGAVVAAIVGFWALRRLAARRGSPA